MLGFHRVGLALPASFLLLTACSGDDLPPPPTNQPPTVSITLPEAPTTTDDIVAEIVAEDPEGRDVELDIRWTQDGAATTQRGATVPASATSKGETWQITVNASDGVLEAEPVTAAVSVANTPPTLTEVELTPDPADSSDRFTATLGDTADADDDGVQVRFRWEADGQVVAETTEPELAPGAVAGGQTLTVVAIPNDGEDDGEGVTSNAVTVSGSVPTIEGVELDPPMGTVATTFRCAPQGWSDFDGDPERYTYRWLVRGVVSDETSATLSAPAFAKGDGIQCEATPLDDDFEGESARSPTVTVQNALPTLSGVEIAPTAPTEADTIAATLGTFADADGDREGYQYSWRVNGRIASTRSTLAPDSFDKGDQIVLVVQPDDGEGLGASVSSSTVTAVNTPPSVARVFLRPESPTAGDTLTATPDGWTDPDPADMPMYTYAWYVNGTPYAATGPEIPGGTLLRNDRVRVEVTPGDDMATGPTVSSSTVTIGNGLPSAPVVEVQPASPTFGDNLSCAITTPSVDPDGDGVTYRYVWRRNGLATTRTSSTVPASATRDRERWTCEVTPFDGLGTGPAAEDSAELGARCASLGFDGVDDRVSAPAFPGLVYRPSGTVEAWVRWDGTARAGAEGNIFTHRPASEAMGLGVFQSDTSGCECAGRSPGQAYFRWASGCGANTCLRMTRPLTANRWHHVAGVLSGSTATLFVDGRAVATTTAAAALDALGANPAYGIGGRADGSGGFFSGQIEAVRLTFTPRYANDFVPARRLESDSETLALWRLDAGNGATVTEATTQSAATISGATWGTEAAICEFDPVGIAEGLVSAFCAHRYRCEPVYNGFLPGQDEEACVAEQASLLLPQYGPIGEMVSDGRVNFDETEYTACLAAYRNVDCELGLDRTACNFLLGQQAVGQPCSFGAECGTNAFCSATGTNQCATCLARAPTQSSCATTPCNETDDCLAVGAQDLCIAFTAPLGAPCGTVATGLCRGRLQCVRNAAGQGTCQRPAGPNQACDTQNNVRAACNIFANQACDGTTCQEVQWRTPGQTCDAINQCDVTGSCIGTSCLARPAAGQTCFANGLCTADHFCDTTNVCRADLAAGAACTTTAQCQSDLRCEAGFCRRYAWDRCE